jgi:hypothetical protein
MSCNNTSCNGCFHNQLELFVQSQEDVWETDSDASEADASEADASDSYESFIEREVAKIQTAALEEGAQRLLDMDFSDDESEFSPEEPKKEEKPPLFKAPIELGECPICYEELKMIDFTVTKCGHTFHSSCVFQALANNLDCPMCRCQLLEVQEDEEDEDQEDEDQEDEDQEDEDQEDEDTEEEEDSRPTMEQLATKLQNMGYTPVDFLTLFMGDILKRQDATRQTEEFLEIFNEKIDDIVDGKITMAHVDQRSYAQVASQAQAQAQQVVRLKDLERIIRQGQQQAQQEAV